MKPAAEQLPAFVVSLRPNGIQPGALVRKIHYSAYDFKILKFKTTGYIFYCKQVSLTLQKNTISKNTFS
jgi:hypothetical protein